MATHRVTRNALIVSDLRAMFNGGGVCHTTLTPKTPAKMSNRRKVKRNLSDSARNSFNGRQSARMTRPATWTRANTWARDPSDRKDYKQ